MTIRNLSKLLIVLAFTALPVLCKADIPVFTRQITLTADAAGNITCSGFGITCTNPDVFLDLTKVGNGRALYFRINFSPKGAPAACTVAVDSSVDGSTPVAGGVIAGTTCTSPGTSTTSTQAVYNYIRINVTALSANKSVTVNVAGYEVYPSQTLPPFTLGSVIFAGTGGLLTQDNANLFWDNTAKQLELGDGTVSAPAYTFKSDPTTGIYRGASAGYFKFASGGAFVGGWEGHTFFVSKGATNHPNVTLYVGESSTATVDVTITPGQSTGYGLFMNPVIQQNTDATDVNGGFIQPNVTDDGAAHNLTNLRSLWLKAATKTANITATNNYTLHVEAATVGSTLNYGIWNQGATLLDNNMPINQKNAAGTIKNLIGLSNGNNIQLGDTGGGFTQLFADNGYYFEGGIFHKYNGIANVESGVPASHWNATATAQSANLSAQAFSPAITSATAGRYRMTCYVAVTQQATTSSTVPTCTLTCTDPTDSVAKTVNIGGAILGVAVNPTTGVALSGTGMCDAKAATGITWGTANYASTGGTAMTYKIYVVLEAM